MPSLPLRRKEFPPEEAKKAVDPVQQKGDVLKSMTNAEFEKDSVAVPSSVGPLFPLPPLHSPRRPVGTRTGRPRLPGAHGQVGSLNPSRVHRPLSFGTCSLQSRKVPKKLSHVRVFEAERSYLVLVILGPKRAQARDRPRPGPAGARRAFWATLVSAVLSQIERCGPSRSPPLGTDPGGPEVCPPLVR
jgi:hypothetical protein